MSLFFCDSFDHYSTVSQKWSAFISNQPPIVSGQGRNGTYALEWYVNGCAQLNFASLATIIVGFAINPSFSNLGTYCRICTFADAGTDQVSIVAYSDGSIKAYRGTTTTNLLGSTAAGALTPGYHYLEIEVTIDPSAGVVTIHLDTVSVLALTGQNTRASSNSSASQFFLGAQSSAGVLESGAANPAGYFDDVYLLNTSGSVNNAFLGDTKVQCVMPTANGSTNQWTIGGSAPAATNWQSVDEIPPNDAVTFVYDATVGQEDLYTFATVASPNVHAVVVNLRASKDDATSRAIRAIAFKTATTIDNGTDFFVTQTTFTDFQGIFELDTTGAQWTAANINSSQFGQKVTV